MFDFCAICMHKNVPLVVQSIERRLLLEAIVSPLMNLAALKPCRLLLCISCNQMLSSMRQFQQKVFKGMMNLIGLHKHHHNEMSDHDLPEVINGQSDLLLPVVNQETVSSKILYRVRPGVRRKAAKSKPEDILYCPENMINILPTLGFPNAKIGISPENSVKTLDPPAEKNRRQKPVIKKKVVILLEKNVPILVQQEILVPNVKNCPSASLSLESEIKRDRYSDVDSSSRPKEALDSAMTVSCDSDFDNPEIVPGYERVVATSSMNDHCYAATVFDNQVPYEKLVAAPRMNSHRHADTDFDNPDSVPYERMVATSGMNDYWYAETPRMNCYRHADTDFENPDSVPYERLVATPRMNGHKHADTDFDNPDSVPYERLVATPRMNGHRHADTDFDNPDTVPAYRNRNDIAVFVPIQNTSDKRISIHSMKSNVKNTKVMGQLRKNIKLSLETCFIIDPESSKPALESTHALDSNSTHVVDSFSTHELDKKSTHVLDSNSKYELNSKLTHELDSKSTHDIDSLSTHDIDSFSTHDIESESTLSCQSDYENAERFPNIVFANAFNNISEDDLSEDIMKKLHVVTNPPSEWPCTWERCYLRHSSEEEYCSDDSDDDSDGTRCNVNWSGRRRREDCKECKLCHKTFAGLYRLWEHYEREHVDICLKECCNGTELKNHTKRRLKVTGSAPSPQFSCRECGYDARVSSQLKLHLTTQRHLLKSQWRFQCDTCKRKFKDKKGLAEHVEREHVAKEATTCPMCSVAFRSARALHKHAAAHVLAQEARALAHAGVHATHAGVHATHADVHAAGARGAHMRKRRTPARSRTVDADSASALTNGSVQKRPRNQKQNPGNARKTTHNARNTSKRTQNVVDARDPTQNPGSARKTTHNARNTSKPTQNAVDAREPTQNPGNARKTTHNARNTSKPTQNAVDAREPTQNPGNARKTTHNARNTSKPTQNAVNARKRTQNARNVRKRKATRRVIGDEEYEDERTAERVADMMNYLKNRTWVEAAGVLDFFNKGKN